LAGIGGRCRGVASHQLIARRTRAGLRRHSGERRATLQGGVRLSVAQGEQSVPTRRSSQSAAVIRRVSQEDTIVQPQQIRELRTLIETNRPVHVANAAATDTDSAIVKYAGGRTLLIVPASTKSLGGRVEIRIRNNGTGIPPDVKEKMFDPFFTTKPAGEGTGLGLSISHDIIVKQHGGSIEVDTRPGGFTEISVTLPRAVIAVPEAGKRV
jgi:signal transduction histidine kinase